MSRLTAYIPFTATPDLKRRLQLAAAKDHRSVGSYLRAILEPILPDLPTDQIGYEIELTKQEADNLTRCGYHLELAQSL